MSDRGLTVKTAGFSYRVHIEENALIAVGKAVRLLFPSTRAMLVSDTTVFGLYGDQVLQSLAQEKWQVETALIRPGERSKTLNGASRLYDSALKAGLDRNSPIIALGGGVVGDLAGFVASTYLRGVPLVMVPTTLLAQVDSSVGGKVAVNHSLGKNLIGSIYPPRLVLIDPSMLGTLSRRHLRAGTAEVIKYGIIKDSAFFYWLEKNIDNLIKGDISLLAEAIAKSVRTKADVVEEDEYEKGHRRVLNFGHTVGHALEASTAYRYYLHGEAVLIGMQAAVKIALHLSILERTSAERIQALLAKIDQKKPPPDLTAEKVIDKLRQDKKRKDNELYFVLPTNIGTSAVVPVNDQQLISEAVASYLQ